MINKFNFYHWAVLSVIINNINKEISIIPYETKSNCSYIIDWKIGIYIKYSEKRMWPWRFSFLREHQDEILDMKNNFKKIFVIFICKDDWIVCLNFEELKKILDHNHDDIEWIAISRGKREKYKVTWSDGKLGYKIWNSDFPEKIFKNEKNNNLFNFLT